MHKKLLAAMALLVVALLTMLAPQAFASFPEDSGALCADSEYFKDRGFDSASAMLESAKDISAESFVLVFYSRYDETSREILPQIKQWADSNRVMIYGIDQYNRYTREYGYFNTKTSFEGWEKYLSPATFRFPAVFIYNSDTRQLTARDNLTSFGTLYNLLNSSGMLKEPYHDYAQAGLSSNRLSRLGLMQGTGGGFDLLRAPTRAEALTMLIRLLGCEEEALLTYLPHPFEDVPRWASPYVGYAYYHGITRGVSENRFDPNSPVTAAEYLTFVLRALGYESGEGGDFVWDDPYALAYAAGIMPAGVNTREFLRADMAVVSYAALSADLKGLDTTLAHRLALQRAADSELLSDLTGLPVSAPSARDEMAQLPWSSVISIDKRSPKYAAEAVNAAIYSLPRVIIIEAPDGTVIDWAVYLMDKLNFPAQAVSDYRLQISGDILFIIPEYTLAAKAYAALTCDGYTPDANASITAQFVRNNMNTI
ncbi:MAG: S-layer homology domain-containing protein, partial [Clostridia bacterium]|nr:S-layer homology domain-containing protein [Clostridia bacterium]